MRIFAALSEPAHRQKHRSGDAAQAFAEELEEARAGVGNEVANALDVNAVKKNKSQRRSLVESAHALERDG